MRSSKAPRRRQVADRAVLSLCSATTARLHLRPWIGSRILENWPADRSSHKNTSDIDSAAEAVSLIVPSIHLDFLDHDFDTWAVRALAHNKTAWMVHYKTGWMLHEHKA